MLTKNQIKLIIFWILLLTGLGGSKFGFILFILYAIYYFKLHQKLNLNILNQLKKENMSEPINIKNVVSGNGKNPGKIAGSVVVILILLWLFFASIVIIDAGETGVYSLFGKVKDEELRSGFHLVIPLAKVTKMSIRTEEYTMSIVSTEGKRTGNDSIAALTKEGLSVDLDITALYRLEENKASDVYREVGLTYDEKIIRPSIRMVIRDVIAGYEAKDIYSEKRGEAAAKISDELKAKLEPRGIVLEDLLLRNVTLPAGLAQAIQEKLQAEQESQKYEFILQKESKEKERKIIEAEGQRDAQQIINQSLSTNYLYYLYINQLKDRQGTIYVPTSPSSGMPMFRNLGE